MLVALLIAGGCALLQRPRLLQASAPQSLRLAASPLAQVPAAAPAPAAAQPPASSGKKGKGRLNIRIDDDWYDLTNWRAAHPAGTHWIDAYNNSDATEVTTSYLHVAARQFMYGPHCDLGATWHDGPRIYRAGWVLQHFLGGRGAAPKAA